MGGGGEDKKLSSAAICVFSVHLSPHGPDMARYNWHIFKRANDMRQFLWMTYIFVSCSSVSNYASMILLYHLENVSLGLRIHLGFHNDDNLFIFFILYITLYIKLYIIEHSNKAIIPEKVHWLFPGASYSGAPSSPAWLQGRGPTMDTRSSLFFAFLVLLLFFCLKLILAVGEKTYHEYTVSSL